MLLSTAAFFSCSNHEKKIEHIEGIRGRFVNNTVLKQISDTIPGGIPFYCTEMDFISKDSVDMSNGFEAYKLKYKKEGDNYLLLAASWKGDMLIKLNNDSTFTLMDSAWIHIPTGSEFKKADESKVGKLAFEYYLNQQMMEGKYILYKENKPTQQTIIFTASGNVNGLKDYVSYSLCYSGDCIGETEPLSNYISFINSKNQMFEYAFKIDKKNKAIRMYGIGPTPPDTKGGSAIEAMVFDLRKTAN
jgi:hypothetical protein